jgi:RNA polymerase sigma-70 factor (ECF subfamily)
MPPPSRPPPARSPAGPGCPEMDAARLFEEHHESLFRFLSRMSGDPDAAADAAQEAFVKLITKPPAPGQTKGWLFRVGINALRLSARTRSRRLRLIDAAPDRVPVGDGFDRPDRALEKSEARRQVRSALDELPERDRTILLMREEGFTHREIAEAVGTTTGSVGTMIARAMDRLAKKLDLDEEDR